VFLLVRVFRSNDNQSLQLQLKSFEDTLYFVQKFTYIKSYISHLAQKNIIICCILKKIWQNVAHVNFRIVIRDFKDAQLSTIDVLNLPTSLVSQTFIFFV